MGNRKNLYIIMAIILVVFTYFIFVDVPSGHTDLSYSEFIDNVDKNRVKGIIVDGMDIKGEFRDGSKFLTIIPFRSYDLYKDLGDKDIDIVFKKEKQSFFGIGILFLLPVMLVFFFWMMFMRQVQAGNSRTVAFGKSKARLYARKDILTFDDVAGVDEAKEELMEIIEFLKNPKKFQTLGGRIPKGVLLVGPPGTGKTLLAKAVAGEAGVPFFSLSGSEFVELYVGVGASRVRDLFDKGIKNAPCIIFIDELDAVGRHRGAGIGGGHDEREQTLNQLLVQMDGFETNIGVILISATNRPDVLDSALLRPGRFDRQVYVSVPDIRGREEIFKVHVRKVPLDSMVDLKTLARGTPGFSGADIANLVNEAALIAARRNHDRVEPQDFEYAKDKVMIGIEKKSLVLSQKEKELIAVHEAGHAVVAYFSPEADPVHKITIIPRGYALGVTLQLPIDDRHNYTREYLETAISILLGGRTAEELVLKTQTSGSSNDFIKATKIARKMVIEFGMSEDIGPISYENDYDNVFLGKDIIQKRNHSESLAEKIDNEVAKIIMQAYEKAKNVISENRGKFDALYSELLENETLESSRISQILGEDR